MTDSGADADDTPDVDPDQPASEQFDLSVGLEDVNLDPERLDTLAAELERAPDVAFDEWPSDHLAEFVAAAKRLENAVEDARKDHAEAELADRIDEGESVGPVRKQSGASTYVEDAEGAFAAVSEAGEDPLAVADVKVSALRDTLGDDADEYLGENSYSYFRRVE